LIRAARLLVLPAWTFGLAAFVLFGFDRLPELAPVEVGISLSLAIGIGWLLRREDEPLAGKVAAPREGMPKEVHQLLERIDGLVGALERGEDRVFEHDVTELDMILEHLRPNARRYLDERGAELVNLRRDVCSAAQSGDTRSADARRAMHYELVRFATAARGQPCGDPYRSAVGNGGVLGAFRDPALAKTWRRYLGFVVLLAVSWGLIWRHLARSNGAASLGMCLSGEVNCSGFIIEPMAAAIAFALVPIASLVAAAAARAAAWRSWAAALPEAESDFADPQGSPLPVLRRKHAWRHRTIRTLAGFGLACGMAVLLGSYFQARELAPSDWATLVGLFGLSLVLIPALMLRIDRGRTSTDLFTLRRAIADAAPVRADLLEQLADTLADTKSLGALQQLDRDGVVAQLRAAASRGPALSRTERDRLLLDVEICETLITAPE
jgi:hypothetical protein